MKLKRNKLLNIFIGAIVSTTIIGLIIGVSAFLYMLHLGYEPITELKDYLWTFIFVLILSIFIIVPFLLIKRKRPNFAIGLLISLLPIGFIFILNIIGLHDFLTPEQFDKKVWIENNPKPYEMSRSLIRDKLTLNLDKQEVIELLGDDYSKEYSDDSTLIYQLDIARIAYIAVHIDKNGLVYKTDYIYYD